MRRWGNRLEIDGSFYDTEFGKRMGPTAEEMAQLVKDNNPFRYEGNAAFFEETIQNMLREIENDQVGRILLNTINRSGRTVRIIPLTWKEQTQLNRIPCANKVGDYSPKGNDCVIWFEPWSRILSLYTGVGSSPYQVLVHELHHAVRQVRGKVRFGGTSWQGTFPHAEELFSVTIENMYLSSTNQSQRMLGTYMQNSTVRPSDAQAWYLRYRPDIDIWCDDLPDLTKSLEVLNVMWNPFNERLTLRNSGF
jgi:hypothetical protein